VRKRKRNNSSSEDSLGKKKKRGNSRETQEENEQGKHVYSREVDRKTILDIKAAETVAKGCKEQIGCFLQFLRAMTKEVKKVLKEEIVSEDLVEYTGRKKLLKKVMLLEEMSCQSVSQVSENFILGYRKSFISVIKKNEKEDTNSGSEKVSPEQKEECKSNENMEEQENDEIIENPKKKNVKPSVHQISDSDNSNEELCESDVNKTEKKKNDSENSKDVVENDSCDELILDKRKSDNKDDQSSSECSKSKCVKKDPKKHGNDELNEKHVDSGEEVVNNVQELKNNSDDSSQILNSDDAGDKKLCKERNENTHLNDSEIVDVEEKGDQVNLKNNHQKLRNGDKTSNDVCEEEVVRNHENELEEHDPVYYENKESNMKNNEEIQVSDEQKTQQKSPERKDVLESSEEKSGSDDDSLRVTNQ